MKTLLSVTGILCSVLLIQACGSDSASPMLGQSASQSVDESMSTGAAPGGAGVRTLVPVSYTWDAAADALGISGKTCAISATLRQEGNECYLDIVYSQAPPRIPDEAIYEE
jgi:hypothetical protein